MRNIFKNTKKRLIEYSKKVSGIINHRIEIMKGKLRKITINNFIYLYSVSSKYHTETETNTFTIKVFLNGQKQTPLVIDFLTIDHYFMGQPLNSGVQLTTKVTNATEVVNLNEPKYIKELILLGQKKGWNGTNKIEVQDGLNYLTEMGFDIDVLKPASPN